MPGRSWQIGRLARIPIGINPPWLVIVALITWSLGATYYPDHHRCCRRHGGRLNPLSVGQLVHEEDEQMIHIAQVKSGPEGTR